jgi:sugar O-acyltransferase (sialic acid O-acetyltransferase NeuD family)
MARLLVYGSAEFGQVIAPLAQDCGFEVAGFIDDWNSCSEVLGSGADLPGKFPPGEFEIAIAIGYRHLDARWNVFDNLSRVGYRFPALIHPKAVVAHSAKVADGSFVMANATVDVRALLDHLVVVWPGAIINHDATIGRNSFLSPGSIICGHSTIGAGCFVGAGAVVVDHMSVPSNTFIKAATRHSNSESKG